MIAHAARTGDPYRLVLTDWQMPEMDGIELARQVHADSACGVPQMVLVMAFGRDQVQPEAEAAGFAGFLFKPIGQSILVDTMVSLFAPKEPVRAQQERLRERQYAVRVLLVEDNDINQQIARGPCWARWTRILTP